MNYADQITSRLPAKLSESVEFAPDISEVMAGFSGQLQEVDSATVDLLVAARDIDRTYPNNQILIHLQFGAPTIGASVSDLETGAHATIETVALTDTTEPLNQQWQLGLSNMTGIFKQGDPISVAGLLTSVSDSDPFPLTNAWLDGCSRIVGARRSPCDSDSIARARILATAAVNASWGRVSDLLEVASYFFGSGVYLNDGGEWVGSSSPWGSSPCINGQVMIEGATGMSEDHYQALVHLLKSAAPAGVMVVVNALRTTHAHAFTFSVSTFGGGDVFISSERPA